MTRKTLTTLLLLGSTAFALPAVANPLTDAERNAIRDRALAEMAQLGYRSDQFERIRIDIDRNEIDVDANGRLLDVDLTFARDGNTLGALIDGDVDDKVARRDLDFVNGSWVEDPDGDDDDDDDRYDDDDRDDDRDDDDDDDRDDDDDDDDSGSDGSSGDDDDDDDDDD